MLIISICLLSSIFLFIVRISTFVRGLYFLLNELVVFYEFELVTLNSNLIVITVLLD